MSYRKRFKTQSTERKRSEPRALGELLPQLMARRGYDRLLAQNDYQQAWEAIAGSLSPHSRPGVLRRGVLEIVVANSTVMQELTFQKRQLVAALAERLPDQKISDLRFVVGNMH